MQYCVKMHTLIFLMTWWPPCKRFSVAKNSSSSLVWPYFMYYSVISIFHPVVLAASAERSTSSSMAVTSQLSLHKKLLIFCLWDKHGTSSGVDQVPRHVSLGTWTAWLKIYALRRAATLAKPLQPVWEKESTAPLYLTRVSLCWLIKKQGPWTTALWFCFGQIMAKKWHWWLCYMHPYQWWWVWWFYRIDLLHANQGVRMGSEVSWIITSWAVTVKVPA